MSGNNKTCCKSEAPAGCTRGQDGTCSFSKVCVLKTAEGEVDCECICTCTSDKQNCEDCVCDCQCTPERAQEIQTADGPKYQCHCTCSC